MSLTRVLPGMSTDSTPRSVLDDNEAGETIMAPLPAHPRRIVAIDWSMIGDLIMLGPCIRALRSAYPETHLAVLGQPNSIVTYKNDPAVNELIAYDRTHGDFHVPSFMSTLRTLRRGHFDTAYVFHNSIGSALMAAGAGIPERIGYRHEGRDLLLTKRIRQPAEQMHLIEIKANLLRQCGIPVEDLSEQVAIDETKAKHWARERLEPKLGHSRPIVAVSLGSTLDTKRWSAEGLNAFLDLFPVNSCDFVLIGAPMEKSLYEGVYSFNNTVSDFVGQTTVEELTWLLDRADMYVGPDSGPMHIAVGRGKPVVALFGPTDPRRCGPLSTDNTRIFRADSACSKCRASSRAVQQCLHTIDPAEIFAAADELLGEHSRFWRSIPGA
jgi:heptosyltransferase-2